MKQLQIDLPKPLHSGDFALGGLAAYGVPNQEQAAQQRGGYGMDFDDARTEISHPESHPDSESSASSFRGNRAAPSHATSIGSSRPCQPPKGRPRPNQVGGNNHPVLQAEIDCLLTHIVEEQQNEMMTGNVVLPWTEIARKLNECGYIRENNLSKTSKYCRDRCDPLCLVTRPAAGAAPPPAPPAPRPLPQLAFSHSALFHRHTPSPAPFVAPSLPICTTGRAHHTHTQVDRLREPQTQFEKVYDGRGRSYHGGGEDSRHQMDRDRQDVDRLRAIRTHGGMAKVPPSKSWLACGAATPHHRVAIHPAVLQRPAAPPALSPPLAPRATAPLSLLFYY